MPHAAAKLYPCPQCKPSLGCIILRQSDAGFVKESVQIFYGF